nr:hypothetical protein [uncultured Massilia sp.]
MTTSLPPTDPAAVQARLDHLFRNNGRDDADGRATATLRRYVETYRLQRDAVPAADTPEVP